MSVPYDSALFSTKFNLRFLNAEILVISANLFNSVIKHNKVMNKVKKASFDGAVRKSKQADFRHNEFKERRIKQALYQILKDKGEVERVYNIVVEQGEY